jgi:hypothetical protein
MIIRFSFKIDKEHPFSTIEKGCCTASLYKNNTDIYSLLSHQRQAFFFLFFSEFRGSYHINKPAH